MNKETYEDNNGNTRCIKYGEKVEGGYCGCFKNSTEYEKNTN